MVQKVVFYIISAVFVLSSLLYSTERKKIVDAVRVNAPISIDGKLIEPVWAEARAVADFLQYDPEEGAQPTEQTEVKIAYDDNALYVGVTCFDSDPEAIVQQLTRRDRTSQSDRISVMIDSYHDHTTAFLFSGSVSVVVSDGILSHDGLVYDVQWDAVWDFSSQLTDRGWSCEFKIPFRSLRFNHDADVQLWGLNLRRYIARKKETDEWVMIGRNETPPGTISNVSLMGHLSGLTDLKPPLHLDILPYTVAKVSDLSVPELSSLHRSISGNTGVDIKYGISNNFTLDAAINPDFGQVEVDQAVLNLTVFETFYPEKRPFFVEGSQIFSFGTIFDNRSLNLFYSRRIGIQPQAPSGTPATGYFYADPPQTTTILGAAKFSGRTDNGLSVGALSALTQEETGREQDINGTLKPSVIFEPRASYNVFRLRQELNGQSSLGIMATGTMKDTRYPSLSGGLDWRLRINDGEYGIDGYLAGSLRNPTLQQRLTGTTGRIGAGKLQDDHWLGFTFYDFSTKEFNINDLGYYSRPRDHGGYTQLTYKEDNADSPLRRYATTLQTNYRWNWEGYNTLAELEFEPSIEFRNFWYVTINYKQMLSAYDDASSGIAGLYRRPAGNCFSLNVQSDIRQPVSLALNGALESTTRGMDSRYAIANLTIRPLTWLEFNPAFTYYRSTDEEAWVIPQYTERGNNLFGLRDIDERDFSLRGTIMMTPRLSLQFFTQVLLVKIHYRDFKELVTPTVLTPYDLEQSATCYQPDYNEQILNANVVLRWEYLPGSTLFLVWTHAREGYRGVYSTSFGEDFGETFRLPINNVLLLKISYYWSL